MATADTGVELDLYVCQPSSAADFESTGELQETKEDLVDTIRSLETDGTIADFNVWESATKNVNTAHRNNAGGISKWALDRFDECSEWAKRHGFNLRPSFRQERLHRLNSHQFAIFPDIYLVASTGVDIQGVFPCSDGEEAYSIDHYLQSLDEGVDWETYDTGTKLTTPDFGPHGSIKAYIKANRESILGPEWVECTDEYAVESERRGLIDLCCKHENASQYLLVEVKPEKDKDKIDKSFGQILRYKHQFLADSNIPNLAPDDVNIAIAAPGFYEFHRKAAADVGIRLITVG